MLHCYSYIDIFQNIKNYFKAKDDNVRKQVVLKNLTIR